MKKFAFIIAIVVIGYGCKPGIPKDILQPKEMEDILFDMHIVDGYLNTLPTGDSVKKVASAYYNGVYKKYGIDSAGFTTSKNYYYQRTDLFKEMYVRITERLTKEKEKQDKIANAPKPISKTDSLEKAKKLRDSLAKIKVDSLTKKKADSISKRKKDSIVNKKRIDSIFKTKKIMGGQRKARPISTTIN